MSERRHKNLLYWLVTCFLLVGLVSAEIPEDETKTEKVPKEMRRDELIKVLDCIVNRGGLVYRGNMSIMDKTWARDGVLRVKYLTFNKPYWYGFNLWVLVLRSKSNSHGHMALFQWERKKKCESFYLANNSEVIREKGDWDVVAPLGGIWTTDKFTEALRRMEHRPVVEIPMSEVVHTCATCTSVFDLK